MHMRLGFICSGRENSTLITTFETQEDGLQSIRAMVLIGLLSGSVKLLLNEKHPVIISIRSNYFQGFQ